MLSFEDDTPMAALSVGLQTIHSTPSGRTSPAEEQPKAAPPKAPPWGCRLQS